MLGGQNSGPGFGGAEAFSKPHSDGGKMALPCGSRGPVEKYLENVYCVILYIYYFL